MRGILHKIEVRDFRSIQALQADFPSNCIYLSGPNGAGKSTVADLVLFALHGGRAPKVSDGAAAGVVKADLSNGWRIERRVPAGGRATVRVLTREGGALPSPQQALDELIGPAATDLDAVAAMKPDDQLEVFLHLAGKADEMAAHKASFKAAYDARRDLNRDIKRNQAAADQIVVPRGVPSEDELAAARARVSAAEQQAEQAREQRHKLAAAENSVQVAADRVEQKQKALAELERLLAQAKTELGQARDEQREAAMAFERMSAEPTIETPDVKALRDEADALADRRAAAGNAEHRQRLLDESEEWSRQVVTLEEQMAASDAGIRALFSGLHGIAFDPESGTVSAPNVRGELLPLADLSDGERLMALVRAMLSAPKPPKILRLKHGSELDSAAMHELKMLAALHDETMLLVERIDSTLAGLELVCVDEDGQAIVQQAVAGPLFERPSLPPTELSPEDQA